VRQLNGVTILPALRDQRRRKQRYPIDPAKVRMPTSSEYPIQILRNFDYRQIVGLANNVRLEKGRLLADIKIEDAETGSGIHYELITAGQVGAEMHSLVALATVGHASQRPPDA
jgi:hypothetical protein